MTATKAIVAAIGVIITALTGALADDVFSASEIGELVALAIESVLTIYAVWKIPNTPKTVTPSQPNVTP